jgi:hypothetical protein
MTRRWGKAGVRLTVVEAAERDRSNAAGREAHKVARAESDRVAHEKWRMGLVVPAHITYALDINNLYGPEVDIACGAREPDVDLWEAGKLYPRWDQILLLSKLTETQPIRFMAPITTLSVYETSMRFHLRPGEHPSFPVHKFTYSALVRARSIGVEAL